MSEEKLETSRVSGSVSRWRMVAFSARSAERTRRRGEFARGGGNGRVLTIIVTRYRFAHELRLGRPIIWIHEKVGSQVGHLLYVGYPSLVMNEDKGLLAGSSRPHL